MLQNLHVLLTFDKVHSPLPLPRETTSEPPKIVRTWCALYIFTSKCASRHNGVHFFDIWTSKSGPYMVCFVHFHFEMCFAPQRRALFRHLNCQKWTDNGVFCTFSLGNALRATTVCTFSTSQLPKVVRSWCVFHILTCKCDSRHNGVHFFISHLASWLRTRRFSEPTFRPSGAPYHWKNTMFRDFPTFSRICMFFLLTLSLLWSSLFQSFSSLCLCPALHLSILSEIWLLNFLRWILLSFWLIRNNMILEFFGLAAAPLPWDSWDIYYIRPLMAIIKRQRHFVAGYDEQVCCSTWTGLKPRLWKATEVFCR